MLIHIKGGVSGYEPENIARMFFPGASLTAKYVRGEDLVFAAAGRCRLAAGVRRGGKCLVRTAPLPQEGESVEFALCSLLYELLGQATGLRMPWGKLTGVRPVRIIHDKRAAGWSEEAIRDLFVDRYDCTPERFSLALQIADLQKPIIAGRQPLDYSLYIGIPFCPSRCSYCSFVSRTIGRDQKLVQPYVDKLCEEVREMKRQAEHCGLNLKTIYIGGGTPTSLSADQLRQLMGTVRECFDLSRLEEYTVEAGRPDCTDAEKLAVIKEYGASRISINPQTFNDQVLANIGRKHSAADILRCFDEARQVGHGNINMDLIAGLPGDTVESFAASLDQAIALDPENITVHTLTLKRASNLVIENRDEAYADVAAMVELANQRLADAGYRPYYLYRQKNTLKNLENTGWCKPGYEGYYNIYIMEEIHSILSAGAGGSTKLCQPGGSRIERIFNYKYPAEYIKGFDEILCRKEGVSAFYARYLDSETTG
ncbi:coproporphyrinogen dehydrogenase HemZ [Fournierella sp.]|uniref:coproporphyrinogen dehydrogenase HemZ n=1 Tax=Allofournierella sp. TaxID=1940256 RepID=UPI003079497B